MNLLAWHLTNSLVDCILFEFFLYVFAAIQPINIKSSVERVEHQPTVQLNFFAELQTFQFNLIFLFLSF